MINWFNHLYPYTNVHELNLDWVIDTVKNLVKEMNDFTGYNEITFANPIDWDASTYYKRFTIVLYSNGNTYISKDDVPVGVPPIDENHWGKIADYNAQIAELSAKICYITPQQFGAVADGVTDDYQAFQDAIEYAKNHDAAMIVVPNGTYYIGTQLLIDYPTCIVGAGVGTACKLIAPNGVSITSQNVIIKDIYLYGDNTQPIGGKTGYGISIDSESNNITLEGVYFAHYSRAIYHTDYFFGLSVNGCRFYVCDYVMELNDMGVGATIYDVNFNDSWFLTTDNLFDLDHCKVTFNHCILDINSPACISTAYNADVTFNDSTFEMTTNIDGSSGTYIIYGGGIYRFNNCRLIENADPSVYWFTLPANAINVTFNSCTLTAYNPSVKCGGLIHPTTSTNSSYEVVEIVGCEFYNARVFALDDLRAFSPRYNIIDGVGVQIFDGNYDTSKMVRNHKYTKYDSSGTFVGEFIWNGFILIPITNPMPANAGIAVGLYTYSTTPYDVVRNGYINIYKGSSNGSDIQLTLYGPGGTQGISTQCKNGVSNIIPVFAGMRVKVVNANSTYDTCQFVPFE